MSPLLLLGLLLTVWCKATAPAAVAEAAPTAAGCCPLAPLLASPACLLRVVRDPQQLAPLPLAHLAAAGTTCLPTQLLLAALVAVSTAVLVLLLLLLLLLCCCSCLPLFFPSYCSPAAPPPPTWPRSAVKVTTSQP